eukprot:scaffold62933_cov18-Phaeocystis_antarctica.AAC.1
MAPVRGCKGCKGEVYRGVAPLGEVTPLPIQRHPNPNPNPNPDPNPKQERWHRCRSDDIMSRSSTRDAKP